MATDKIEGAKRVCSVCKTPLVCKKVISTWNEKTSEKLQWQNAQDGKPHYYFVSKDNYSCNKPKFPEDIIKEQIDEAHNNKEAQKIPENSSDQELKKLFDESVTNILAQKVANEHPEIYAEAINLAKWASENAHKLAKQNFSNLDSLSTQEKSALGQKEGMLTRLLADLVMKLREQQKMKTDGDANGK